MSKKNFVPDEQTKWFQRGFTSKNHYIGWLQFNDLVDESFGYDDTYYDHYSGKTIRIGGESNPADEDFEIVEEKTSNKKK